MDDIPEETVSTIRNVLLMEEEHKPDWRAIEEICDAEISRLNEAGLGGVVNDLPYHFLEDYDIRRKDDEYGSRQRDKVRGCLGL